MRMVLADRTRRLTAWLGAAGGDAARPYVAAMLGSFPSAVSDDGDAAAKISAYCIAMAQLPLWAVSEACAMALRGHVGNSRGRFAPTPGELCLAGERLLESVVKEKSRIARILTAKVVEPETVDPERRKQIAEQARRLIGGAVVAATGNAQPALKDYASMPVSLSAEALARTKPPEADHALTESREE